MGGIRTTMPNPQSGKMLLLTVAFVVMYVLSGADSAGIQTSFSLLEEESSGKEIGNLISSTSLSQLLASTDPSSIEFKILQGSYKPYFAIDNSGVLSTSSVKLDRDAMCPNAATCTLTIDVALVKPEIHFQFIKVTITVQDINDISPMFPSDSEGKHVLAISENTPKRTPFVLPGAEDTDSPRFGIKRYTFLADTSTFRLVVTNNSDGNLDLQLLLTEKLDREATAVYNAQIVAYDGGEPPRSGYLPLEIRILDANDNSPTFDNATYIRRLPEDTEPRQTIITVHATDPDHGPNGQITYSFTTQTVNQHGEIFGINEQSGEISLKQKVDYEKETTYNLQVTARDQGPDARMAHAKVVLHVVDINDHPPVISVSALTTTGLVEISEAANISTFVAHISVQDSDAGPSGEVQCSLQDNNFQLVELFPSEYKMETIVRFDRETKAEYRVIIHCSDKGDDPLTTTDEISVTILDENDHTPVFRQAAYGASLRENNTVGAPVLRVSATDGDIGKNANIFYKLHEDAKNLVFVSPEGVISTNGVFDHEKMNTFTFHILAVDKGTPALTATALVTLTIIDINDEAPTFEKPDYTFGTYESQPPGTEIGTVSATDRDDSPFNEFTFSLHSRGDIENFRIDKDTGKIVTKTVLDREFKAAHYLSIVATDSRYPYQSSMVNVSIFVADINDNAPNIKFPVVGNNTVQVSSYSPKGHIFMTTEAEDADLGDNGILRFFIAKGNEEGIFDIDPATGGVSVMRDLSAVNQDWFVLTLMVKDTGSPQRTAVAVLNVQVNRTKAYAHVTGMLGKLGSAANGNDEGDNDSDEGTHLSYHQKIIVILAAVTAVIVAILITAIVCIKRRQIKQTKEEYRYMCRVDLAQRLSTPSPTPANMTRMSSEPDGQTVGQTDSMRARKAKEVHFNLAAGDSLNRQDWSRDGQWTHLSLQDKQTEAGQHAGQSSQQGHGQGQGQGQGQHGVPPLKPPVRTTSLSSAPRHGSFKLPSHLADEKEVEMHQLLNMLRKDGNDTDSTSGCSADGSNTDSGRGPSEEGDHHHHIYANHPHLPPRGIPRIPEGQESDSQYKPPSYTSLNCEPKAIAGVQPKGQLKPSTCSGTNGCQGQSCTCSHGNQHHQGNPCSSSKYQPKPAPRTSSLKTSDPSRNTRGMPMKSFNRALLAPSSARSRYDDTSDTTSNASSTSGSFIVDLGSDSFKAVDV